MMMAEVRAAGVHATAHVASGSASRITASGADSVGTNQVPWASISSIPSSSR